jgi:hypothetical protein
MNKAYFWGGLLLVCIFLFVSILTRFVEFQGSSVDKCTDDETGQSMTWFEAREIALASECVAEGTLTDVRMCNQFTGTWWIDIDLEKPGCAPACVVNVVTGEATMNWRCTGALP